MRADAAAVAMGGVGETCGAEAVAGFYSGRAQAARPALVDNAPGAVVSYGGALRIAISFTVIEGRIVAIDVVADPEQLDELDLQVRDDAG